MLESEWEIYKPIVRKFTRKTGISVNVVLAGSKWEEIRQSVINTGTINADVVTLEDFDVGGSAGYLVDLTGQVLSGGFWNSLYPKKAHLAVYRSRIYSVPWRADALAMYVNVPRLSEAGLDPPNTMEDLLKTARILYQKDGIGRVGLKARQYEGLTTEIGIFLGAYGGNFNELYSKTNIEVFTFLRDLVPYIHPKSRTWDEGSIPQAMIDNEIYIDFNWPYQHELLEENGLSDLIRIFPTPEGPLGRGTTLGGGQLAIPKKSVHQEAAWQFITYIASRETQANQIKTIGWLPIRADAWDILSQIDPSRYSILSGYRESLDFAIARPAIANYNLLSALWQKSFKAIVWDGGPITDILKQSEYEWETAESGTK